MQPPVATPLTYCRGKGHRWAVGISGVVLLPQDGTTRVWQAFLGVGCLGRLRSTGADARRWSASRRGGVLGAACHRRDTNIYTRLPQQGALGR